MTRRKKPPSPRFHTLPNYLTLLRVALVPFFVWALVAGRPGGKLLAAVLFAVASLTDWLDGWIARKWNLVTEIGIVIDQSADKLLVWSALIAFLFDPSLHLHWVWVAVIVFRDLFITVVRAAVKAATGRQMVTSPWGKAKAAVQMAAIIVILVDLAFRDFAISGLKPVLDAFESWRGPLILVVVSSLLALVSLAKYLVDNRPALAEFLEKRR